MFYIYEKLEMIVNWYQWFVDGISLDLTQLY